MDLGASIERVKQRARRVRGLGTAIDVHDRVSELGGGFLASAVTLALFLSLFPLLFVALSVVGFFASGDPDLAGDLVADLGLTGAAADTLQGALASARDSRQATSVVGVAGLVWAALGVVGAVQHVCNRAWQVPGRGLLDKLVALGWLLGSSVLLGSAFALTGLFAALPGWLAPLQLLASLALTVGFFLLTFRVLTARSLPVADHLPGAVLGGVGFHVLTVVAAFTVPRAVASSSALYGSLGVVLAILGWLLLFGRLLVYSVVLNVVRHERRHGVVAVPVEAPAVGDADEEAVRADRSAVVTRERRAAG